MRREFTGAQPSPRVAIVLAKGGTVLGWAAKGVGGELFTDNGTQSFKAFGQAHAEKLLLSRIDPADVSGARAYVTLEPCTKRNKGTACADL